jgi:hypothetical protein
MNQMSGKAKPSFTPKHGQYLAFIDAYTASTDSRRPNVSLLFRRHTADRAPDDHHSRTRWSDPKNTGRPAQHRGHRSVRKSSRLAGPRSTVKIYVPRY